VVVGGHRLRDTTMGGAGSRAHRSFDIGTVAVELKGGFADLAACSGPRGWNACAVRPDTPERSTFRGEAPMAEIRLTGVNKVYPGGTHAVHDVDLQIADGEFMIMVGPSGCAKSTILRMIAGLETPTGGTVEIGGRVVNDVAPKDRDIAMVFQSYALYPHMTVRENMAFGLKLRRMPQQEIDQRVSEAARILGLEQLLDRLPKAMSGGQRQRVAMGRAIVREPQAFLMDEPLSNLDAKLRVQMRTEIAKLHQRLGTTTVYVTHDQVEAMTLGQRICILRKGVVQQIDTPFQVYQNPANVFVGGFIGSPGMNFMDGHLLIHDGMLHLQLGDRVLALPASVSSRLTANADVHGKGVVVGIRPEHLAMTTDADPHGLPVSVELTEAMGAEVYAYFTAAVTSPDLTALSDTQATSDTFVARLAAGVETRGGERIMLRPDLDEVHLFDPATMATLLAPAAEADVRARQAGAAVAMAGGTAMRPAAPVAAPGAASTVVQPGQMILHAPIHLHQTFMGTDATTGTIGTIADADPERIAAVFDQPVAPPIAVEPLVARAVGAPAAPVASADHGGGGAMPRPSFAQQVGAGTSLDPAFASLRRTGGAPPAGTMPVPGAQLPEDDAGEHVDVAPAPTPSNEVEVPEAPARRRGFAPRTIGTPPAPPAVPASPGARVQADDAELAEAIEALEDQDAQRSGGVLSSLPGLQLSGPAPGGEGAAAPHAPSSFRGALARLRTEGAPVAPMRTGLSSGSLLPPPMQLDDANSAEN
jgi:multiple sugar transport system ATP-binding protein